MFTSFVNLMNLPEIGDKNFSTDAEFNRYVQIWGTLSEKYSAVIIQNNFDLSPIALLGNLDCVENFGIANFLAEMNLRFAEYARTHKNFFIHDLQGLSARIGLSTWHNSFQYHAYKIAINYDVMPEVALNLSKIIRVILGKNKKCLVLDLDK